MIMSVTFTTIFTPRWKKHPEIATTHTYLDPSVPISNFKAARRTRRRETEMVCGVVGESKGRGRARKGKRRLERKGSDISLTF